VGQKFAALNKSLISALWINLHVLYINHEERIILQTMIIYMQNVDYLDIFSEQITNSFEGTNVTFILTAFVYRPKCQRPMKTKVQH